MELTQQLPRILLADSQPIYHAGIAAILQQRYPKATFGHAMSFREAREKLVCESWNLMICDLTLSDRCGFELIQETRQLVPPVPTLVLSTNPVQPYGYRAIKCGAAAYLQRDIPAEELLNAIDHLLRGHRYITRSLALALADAADESNGKPPHETLSEREMQVLIMLAEGKSIKNIGADLSLSPKTVSTYRGRVINKLKLTSDADLVKYCLNQNLIPPLSSPMHPPVVASVDVGHCLHIDSESAHVDKPIIPISHEFQLLNC